MLQIRCSNHDSAQTLCLEICLVAEAQFQHPSAEAANGQNLDLLKSVHPQPTISRSAIRIGVPTQTTPSSNLYCQQIQTFGDLASGHCESAPGYPEANATTPVFTGPSSSSRNTHDF